MAAVVVRGPGVDSAADCTVAVEHVVAGAHHTVRVLEVVDGQGLVLEVDAPVQVIDLVAEMQQAAELVELAARRDRAQRLRDLQGLRPLLPPPARRQLPKERCQAEVPLAGRERDLAPAREHPPVALESVPVPAPARPARDMAVTMPTPPKPMRSTQVATTMRRTTRPGMPRTRRRGNRRT